MNLATAREIQSFSVRFLNFFHFAPIVKCYRTVVFYFLFFIFIFVHIVQSKKVPLRSFFPLAFIYNIYINAILLNSYMFTVKRYTDCMLRSYTGYLSFMHSTALYLLHSWWLNGSAMILFLLLLAKRRTILIVLFYFVFVYWCCFVLFLLICICWKITPSFSIKTKCRRFFRFFLHFFSWNEYFHAVNGSF